MGVNGTEQIINNVPEVKTVVAVIQRTGYIEVENISQMVTIVGVNFTEYMKIYSTFSAEIGEIPLSPSNDTVVLGARVADPWENGTLICEVNDSVELLWTVREKPYSCKCVLRFLCCCNFRGNWWLWFR